MFCAREAGAYPTEAPFVNYGQKTLYNIGPRTSATAKEAL